MTPAETMFEALSGWQPAGPGPHVTRVLLVGPVEALTLTASRADGLSCLLDELAVAFRAEGEVTAESLTRLAVAAAEQVTGLAEPLKVYEVDSRQGRALLRSATPAERGGQRLYYELALNGLRAASLRRYAAPKTTGGRKAMPFALTHEAVVKVTEGLAAAATPPEAGLV